MVVEAPFLAILSEKVEAELFNNEFDTSGVKNFIYSVILGVKNSIILLVITIFWSFIFFIGNFILPAISSLLGVIIIGYFYGVSFMTYSAELRGHSYFSLRKILKGVRYEVLGFGVLGYLFVLIPLFAPIFLPIAVVGATMLYNECIENKSFDIKLLNK
jgi:CysZ protein